MIELNYKENFVNWIKNNLDFLPDDELEVIAERIDNIIMYYYYSKYVDEEIKKEWKENIEKHKLCIK